MCVCACTFLVFLVFFLGGLFCKSTAHLLELLKLLQVHIFCSIFSCTHSYQKETCIYNQHSTKCVKVCVCVVRSQTFSSHISGCF